MRKGVFVFTDFDSQSTSKAKISRVLILYPYKIDLKRREIHKVKMSKIDRRRR